MWRAEHQALVSLRFLISLGGGKMGVSGNTEGARKAASKSTRNVWTAGFLAPHLTQMGSTGPGAGRRISCSDGRSFTGETRGAASRWRWPGRPRARRHSPTPIHRRLRWTIRTGRLKSAWQRTGHLLLRAFQPSTN
jgi:hypothetical protein